MKRFRGFTLLEVMIALALLGLGLTVLIKSAAGSIYSAQQAHMMGVATDLARGKMYDLEEMLLKDGFSDTEQHEEDQTFTDEGWPQIHYSYKIEEVELPSFETLEAMAAGSGSAAGAGAKGGSGGAGGAGKDGSNDGTFGGTGGGFGDSALGGMLGMMGGGGMGGGSGKGSDIDAAMGGNFIQSQYTMFQQVLKVTIRKVTLTLTWQVMGYDRDLKTVMFLTDASAMDKVLNGLGSQEPAGSGSGSDKNGGGNTGGSGTRQPGMLPAPAIPPNTAPPPGVGG